MLVYLYWSKKEVIQLTIIDGQTVISAAALYRKVQNNEFDMAAHLGVNDECCFHTIQIISWVIRG